MNVSPANARRARAASDAAEWAVRLSFSNLSPGERAEFVVWLRESPVHVAEMLRCERLRSALAEFDGWDRITSADEGPLSTVVPLALRPSSTSARRPGRFARTMWSAGIAAALTGVVISLFLVRQQTSVTTVHTEIGERREISLADGSLIRLSPRTDLRVRFGPRTRSVAIERGEALFRVAKDPTRPFVVEATEARVQAVGTIFSVARNADAVVVTVTEGRVKVMSSAVSHDRTRNPGFSDISLNMNERISVSARGIASPVRRVANIPTAEWDAHQLVFEDMRVAEVAAQFNRHNHIQIRIADSQLASRTVSGVFDANDPKSFIDFLRSDAGVSSIEHGSEEIVVVTSAAAGGPIASPR